MSELRFRNRGERRRLRLELLETRCLLTAAPLLLFTPDELPWKLPDSRDLNDARHDALEVGRARPGHGQPADVGPNSRGDGDLGPRRGRQDAVSLRPQTDHLRPAGPVALRSGLAPVLASPSANGTAEQLGLHNDLVQATKLSVPRTSLASVAEASGHPMDQVSHSSRQVQFVLVPIQPAAIFVIISDELAADVARQRDEGHAQAQPTNQLSAGNASPRPGLRVQTDLTPEAQLASSEQTPTSRRNLDQVLFKFNSPSAPTDPRQYFEGSSIWQAVDEGVLRAHDLADDPNGSLDFALKSLFPDSDGLGTQEDLRRLLESLAEERGLEDQFSLGRFSLDGLARDRLSAEQPASDGMPANAAELTQAWSVSQNPVGSPSQAAWQEAAGNLSRTLPIDGMIALELPDDLLIANSQLWDLDLRDQSAAWTARIGLYRAHELASAGAGTASLRGPTNLPSAVDLSQREQLGDSIVASRLRPIVAATSVAFGAIFIRFRQRRRARLGMDREDLDSLQ